jgi:sugar phosphate isomerase/epimerase
MIDGLLLHSVSYSGSWGQPVLSLDSFVDHAADLGFDGVMLMAKRPHLSILDYGSKELARLRQRIEKRGIHAVCIAGYTNFTADLGHPDIPNREYQIQHVTDLARAARELGAATVRVFTGYLEPAVPFQQQWDMVVRSLREAADRAAAFDIVIGVQNHHDVAVDPESLHDLIREVDHDHCRAMFDAWAPALQGLDIASAAQKLGALTVHTTVANYVVRPQFRYLPSAVNYEKVPARAQAVPMEEGFIDYGAFLKTMTESGFRGTVAYEMCSPLLGGATLENLDRHAASFLNYMRTRCAASRLSAATSKARQETAPVPVHCDPL